MNAIAHYRSYWFLILVIILLPISPVLAQELSGVQTVGNDFYGVFVDASTGLYTTRTGQQHPAGAGISVLYNGDSQSP
ncbi:MAG: hypothetical protein IH587_08690, partial [Anaerolineae bacterium]|nr:hypothetical protein [Anaerolineae bacterium]